MAEEGEREVKEVVEAEGDGSGLLMMFGVVSSCDDVSDRSRMRAVSTSVMAGYGVRDCFWLSCNVSLWEHGNAST